MKSLFIVNPRSGRQKARHLLAGVEGEIVTCEAKDQLDTIIAGALGRGVEVVYAVGGDGTVHEIATRLIGSRAALGIIPVGSGNGLARHLGIPLRAKTALSTFRDGLIATIDTATVNDVVWIGVMGVGLDAVIAEHFADSSVRGLRTYIRVGLHAFRRFEPETYEIDVDGVTYRRTAFVVAVANSSQYGNNARIAPLASLQDGVLDVVIIEHVSALAAPFMLLRLFNGTLHQSRRVTILQGRNVTVRRSASGPAHVDGEPVILPETLRVRVRPQSLRVLLPRSAARI